MVALLSSVLSSVHGLFNLCLSGILCAPIVLWLLRRVIKIFRGVS